LAAGLPAVCTSFGCAIGAAAGSIASGAGSAVCDDAGPGAIGSPDGYSAALSTSRSSSSFHAR